jgi:hypothetical protein
VIKMKPILSILVFAVSFALVGCETTQSSVQTVRQDTQAYLQSVAARLKSDSVLSKISGKIWLESVEKTPLTYYSNNDRVSDDEKQAIQRLAELQNIFDSERQEIIKKHNLPVLDLNNLASAALSSLLIDLYLGKITYGEFAIKRRDISNNFDAAILERDKQIAATQRVQKDVAYNNLQNYLMNQNLVNSLNQPARISPFTCNRFGSMVSCR